MRDKERRQYIRFNIDLAVSYQLDVPGGESPGDPLPGICKNLSIEGMCMTCKEELEQDANIDLRISLPSQEGAVHLKGVVCWCKPSTEEKEFPYEVGVKLMTVSKNEETRFILFVCELMKQDLMKYIQDGKEE